MSKKPVQKKPAAKTARPAAKKKPAAKAAPKKNAPAMKKTAAAKVARAAKPALKKAIAAKKTAVAKKTVSAKAPAPAKKAAPVKADAAKKPALVKLPAGKAVPQKQVAPVAKPADRPLLLRPAAETASRPARAPRPVPPPPPSRPVPAKEMARYRALLEIRKAAILESFNDYRARSQGLGEDGTQDIGDQATNSYNKEFFLSLSEEQRGQIKAIDEALRRIDRVVYGICAACGDEIESRRLNAVPWSSLCLRCQDAHDQVRPEAMM